MTRPLRNRTEEADPIVGRRRRPALQRGVIILPSAFTLGNLFFGIYAIVAATRGDLVWAGWFIIFAGILDMLDGRIARFTRTGSAFARRSSPATGARSASSVDPSRKLSVGPFSPKRDSSWE